MTVYAIRGAITVEGDTPEAIGDATELLIKTVLERNKLEASEIISIFFTVTNDISSYAPAAALREREIVDVPLLCASEMNLRNGLDMCIRLFAHINSKEEVNREVRHVFLRGATQLRPDLAEAGDEGL